MVSSQQGHPVFVVIKSPPVGEPKVPNLTSGEDLLDIVDLDVKPEAEVRIKAERSRRLCSTTLVLRRSTYSDSSVLDDPRVHASGYGGSSACRYFSTLLPGACSTAGGGIAAKR